MRSLLPPRELFDGQKKTKRDELEKLFLDNHWKIFTERDSNIVISLWEDDDDGEEVLLADCWKFYLNNKKKILRLKHLLGSSSNVGTLWWRAGWWQSVGLAARGVAVSEFPAGIFSGFDSRRARPDYTQGGCSALQASEPGRIVPGQHQVKAATRCAVNRLHLKHF